MASNATDERGDQDRAEHSRLRGEVDRLRSRFPDYPRRYLYILMAVGAVDSADRTILATVFEDVKKAFHISDSKLGVLTAAYSVVATLSVIPFGWLADRWNRVRLIALGFLPWAAAMFITGASQSFTMMFAGRLFLGSIEATNGPSTPSLLGDYYPVNTRSRLMGIYGVGTLIGTVAGLSVGGIIATLLGWRMAFFIWGAMGLVCAAIVLRTLPEPARGVADALHHNETKLASLEHRTGLGPTPSSANGADASAPEPEEEEPGFGMAGMLGGSGGAAVAASAMAPEELVSSRPPGTFDYRDLTPRAAAREIFRVKTMWIIFAAGSTSEFIMSGLSIWAVTYFRRYYHLSAAGGGSIVGVLAISAVAGIITGARLGDRYMKEGHPTRRIRLSAVSQILSVFTLMIAFGVQNLPVAVPFFLMSGFFIGLPMAPLDAVGLDILVSHIRGRSSSLRSLIRVGASAGSPLLFGFMSDNFGLRQTILMSAPTLLVAGLITLVAIKTYPSDLAHAMSESARQAGLEHDGSVPDPAEVTTAEP